MLIIRRAQELSLRAIAGNTSVFRNYSKDYASSSDDEKPQKKQKKPSKKTQDAVAKEETNEESASARLNRLLATMQKEEKFTLMAKNVSSEMARPGEAHQKRKAAVQEQRSSKDIFKAAKRVASLLGEENKQQTESELLAKLLGHPSDEATTEKDEVTAKGTETDKSLSDLIVGMKIDRRQQSKEPTRADFVRRVIASKNQKFAGAKRLERKREPEVYTGSVNLFGGQPMGLFTAPEQLRQSEDMLQTWAHLQRRDLKLQVTHPPANYFEKIARWTEQGRVWRFPIDNEQDWSQEHNVDFSEHIFLEQHLEPWCPERGPIRHFMELVCVGLSKNPYLTAQEKKDHVFWYRDYFESKKDMLQEFNVVGPSELHRGDEADVKDLL